MGWVKQKKCKLKAELKAPVSPLFCARVIANLQ